MEPFFMTNLIQPQKETCKKVTPTEKNWDKRLERFTWNFVVTNFLPTFLLSRRPLRSFQIFPQFIICIETCLHISTSLKKFLFLTLKRKIAPFYYLILSLSIYASLCINWKELLRKKNIKNLFRRKLLTRIISITIFCICAV